MTLNNLFDMEKWKNNNEKWVELKEKYTYLQVHKL